MSPATKITGYIIGPIKGSSVSGCPATAAKIAIPNIIAAMFGLLINNI